MNLKLIDIINFIALFQLSVFVFFLLKRKPGRQANKILGGFLFIQILLLTNFELLRHKEYISQYSSNVFYIGNIFILLAGPTFYFYVKSLAFKDFILQKKHILHTIPFFIFALILILNFHIYPSGLKRKLVLENNVMSNTFWLIANIVILSQILIYFIIDLKILKGYRSEIKQQFSSINKINLSWLSLIIYCFIIAWFSSVLGLIGRNYFNIHDEFVFINFLTFFIFFNIIYYKGFARPEIFSGIEERLKYQSSKLSDTEGETYISRLLEYMDDNKPYLNPNLTLKELATQTSIPNRYLSQIINESMSMNFYDFISKYRIEEAKKIFNQKSNKTVLEVLYEVGFNSKSSFNTTFKKFTGITPTQFKKEMQENKEVITEYEQSFSLRDR
jgi:AraC-like DNA-binding protein